MAIEHPQTIWRFSVLGYLGSAASGRSYRALDPRTNQACVVQLIDPELVAQAGGAEALRQEIAAIAGVVHPNVSRILEVQLEQEPYYLTTEYVPGATLREVIDHRRLSFVEALRIFKDICAALQAIHRRGIFHHALSPHSVVLTEDLSTVKLTNFGLGPVDYFKARMSASETLTFDAGPLSYLAPEHVRELRVDARTDVYSAGVILYECLTGAVPAGRFNLPSQRNSEVPPELDPIVLRCLSSDPEHRYPSVQHLQSEIRLIEEKLRLGLAHTIQGGVRSHQSAAARPLRLALIAAVLLLLVVAALVGLAAWRHSRRPAPAPAESETPVEPPATPPAAADLGGAPPAETAAVVDDAGAAPVASTPTDVPPVAPSTRPAVRAAPPPSGGERRAAAAPTAPGVAEERVTAGEGEEGGESTAAADYEVIARKVEDSLYQPALADIEAFVDRHPDAPELLEAFRLRARVQAALGQAEPLRATILEMETRFRTDARLPAALYSLARTLLADPQRRYTDQAKRLLEAAATGSPDAPWASEALFAKAEIELAAKEQANDPALGRVPAGALTLRRLAELYPSSPKAAQALGRAAQLFEEAKQYEAAGDAYLTLAKSTADSDAAWKAARLFDRRSDQRSRALEAYRLVAQSSPHYGEAQKRIARLAEG
jgi:hypothetical protein